MAQLQKHESELVSQMNDLRESLEASQSSSSAEVQELRASKEALESQVSTLQSELESQSAALTQAQSSSSAEVQELRASKEARLDDARARGFRESERAHLQRRHVVETHVIGHRPHDRRNLALLTLHELGHLGQGQRRAVRLRPTRCAPPT